MKYLLCILQFFLLAGCAAERNTYLPGLEISETAGKEYGCNSVYPQGNWQFVHSIDFSRGDGSGTSVVGITTLHADMIRSALVTVEGFTLFEADFYMDNSLQIHRAVPPFDSRAFAEGMMADIRAIFRPPATETISEGLLSEGATACRFNGLRGQVTDILPNIDDCWQITSYTPERILDRSITGRSCRVKESTRIPEYLELQTYGMTGYTLKMKLLRADRIQ